ncbi:MAG: MgtC/SapB family protein [Methanothrix sp.]|uniref:MgtC/SapB family protein n=1 Tax=Methanothrix sp. TaxID=90426 RepID=UPI003BB6017B
MDFIDIYPFLVAMLIGALIGTERQRRLAEEKVRGVAGLRTFILISLLGALSATLAAQYGPLFAVGALSSFIILVAVGYASAVSSLGRIDLTAAVAAVVAFVLGMLANDPDKITLAVSLAIITTWILATRTVTHRYVEALNETDLLDTLKMGIIALVIYPILPEEPLDQWGLINLRQIWLFVILVSLIGYTGYILIRILGAERGLTLTGILGGLASSIAVTSSLAEESKINPQILSSAVFATAIASSTVFPRVLFIAALINRDLLADLFIPLMTMTVVGAALAYLSHHRNPPQGGEVKVSDPFRILPALKLGLLFALVLIISRLAGLYFGDTGIYAASILSGLVDVDAITLSMATLARSTLTPSVAATSITLAVIANTLVKLGIAYVLGSREFGNRTAVILLPMALAGILSMLLI